MKAHSFVVDKVVDIEFVDYKVVDKVAHIGVVDHIEAVDHIEVVDTEVVDIEFVDHIGVVGHIEVVDYKVVVLGYSLDQIDLVANNALGETGLFGDFAHTEDIAD
jgi:hypothetical protein